MARAALLLLTFLVPESDRSNSRALYQVIRCPTVFKTLLRTAPIRNPGLPSCSLGSAALTSTLIPRHPNTHTRSPVVVLQGFGSPNLVPTPKIRKSTQTRLPGGSSVPIATAPRTRVALPAGWPGRTRDVTAPLSGG